MYRDQTQLMYILRKRVPHDEHIFYERRLDYLFYRDLGARRQTTRKPQGFRTVERKNSTFPAHGPDPSFLGGQSTTMQKRFGLNA